MENDIPPSNSAELDQFNWISNWLSKRNLNKTLDVLLDEYSDTIDTFVSAEKIETRKTVSALSDLQQTLSFHKSSVLTVRFHREKPWIISTDSAKNLIVSSLETGEILSGDRVNNPFMGAIISLELNPKFPNLIVIGTMDEQHALIEIKETDQKVHLLIHQKWHSHTKYVVRAKWAPNGMIFATASHDQSLIFWKLDESLTTATEYKKFFFKGNVEAIEFTQDGQYLIAAIREDPFLQYINLDNWDITLLNSNALGDDFVSFTILELKQSPDGGKVLASTDMSRAILFRRGTGVQLRNFYGYESDGYSQPRTVFDNHGMIYLTSQDFRVYIYDYNSGIQIDKLPPHSNVVRDLDYHPHNDLLATCSYDKSIKIWRRCVPK